MKYDMLQKGQRMNDYIHPVNEYICEECGRKVIGAIVYENKVRCTGCMYRRLKEIENEV
jgi:DNA-directed RNA polymerase subunit RPC12/RpoP